MKRTTLARITGLRRTAPLPRTTPLPARVVRLPQQRTRENAQGRSAPRTRQQERADRSVRALAKAKAAVQLREGGMCARCWVNHGVDPHHRTNRGMGGASADPTVHALSRLLWLCRSCHDWIGMHPAAAETAGYLLRHSIVPLTEVRVLYRGAWALLGDDGSITYLNTPGGQL